MKQVISTEKAPKALGPYSQGIHCGLLYFFSGQIPYDPIEGNVVGKTIEEQTRWVLTNIQTLLADQGLSVDDVVKTTVFLKNLEHFATFNIIYAQVFTENPPARSTVEVSRLPKDVLVEIEVIAMKEKD